MPVDMSKYPKDWPEIRARILRRAGGGDEGDDARVGACCEWCGVRNYAVGWRDEAGNFHPVGGNAAADNFEYATSYGEARKLADHINDWCSPRVRHIVIVLTIAHVDDPDPMNVAEGNLAAVCQRCHNVHDRQMRECNRWRNQRKALIEAGQLLLPLG